LHLHILPSDHRHEISLVLETIGEVADNIVKTVKGRIAEIKSNQESTQEEAGRILGHKATEMAGTFEGIHEKDLEEIFGGHDFFYSALATLLKGEERKMLRLSIDRRLLSEIGQIEENKSIDTASYIVLSQILLLRLFSRARPDIIALTNGKITHYRLRSAFMQVLNRPIFEIDLLDAVPENYVQDTFDLIWGLQIERIRSELPGRLFHELMPEDIRKMLAAFYTSCRTFS
jgi:hypothetical protein